MSKSKRKMPIDPSNRLYAVLAKDLVGFDNADFTALLSRHGWERKPEFETGSVEVWHDKSNEVRVTLPPDGDQWRSTTLCDLIGTFAYVEGKSLFEALRALEGR